MSNGTRYVQDEGFLRIYHEYQCCHADQIAERDKGLLRLIADKTRGEGSLLDTGCCTGNLLLHLKRAFPRLILTGGDLAESSLDVARANPQLAGVDLRRMDMLDIPGRYDVIMANVVTFDFEWDTYEAAASSIARALAPSGYYFAL